jgi:hypothetical protein
LVVKILLLEAISNSVSFWNGAPVAALARPHDCDGDAHPLAGRDEVLRQVGHQRRDLRVAAVCGGGRRAESQGGDRREGGKD